MRCQQRAVLSRIAATANCCGGKLKIQFSAFDKNAHARKHAHARAHTHSHQWMLLTNCKSLKSALRSHFLPSVYKRGAAAGARVAARCQTGSGENREHPDFLRSAQRFGSSQMDPEGRVRPWRWRWRWKPCGCAEVSPLSPSSLSSLKTTQCSEPHTTAPRTPSLFL